MARKLEVASDLICKINPVKENNQSSLVFLRTNSESSILIASGSYPDVSVLSSEPHLAQLQFPSDVTRALIRHGDDKTTNLWVTTEDGTVCLVPDVEKTAHRQSEDKRNESGDDIFDDLADAQKGSVTANSLDVQECSVLKLPGAVLTLQIIRDLIVFVSKVKDAGYLLTWYDARILESHTNKAERLQNYKNLGETFLPCFSNTCTGDSSYFHSPVIAVVSTTESPINNGASQAKCINKYLYNNLFGVNNNLLEADIVLLGLPNGHVYSSSLKAHNETPRLLYDLREPIVGIYTLRFEEELSELEEVMGHNSNKTNGNCLLLVGSKGKIICVFCSEHKKEIAYKEIFIPGRVVCAHYVQSTLLLATDTELLMVHAENIQNASEYQYLQCQGLNLFNVRAICTSPAELGTHLYVLCKRGQVLHRQINFENVDSLSFNKSKRKLNLKDLLTSIGHVSDRLKHTQKEVNDVNHILEQLAIASSMVFSTYTNISDLPNNLYPLDAHVSVRHVDLGSVVKFILVIHLVNTGLVSLGENWSVILNINSQTESDLVLSTKQSSKSTCTSYNKVIVQKCHQSLCALNGVQEIHHELPADVVSKLPLNVVTSLSYTLPNIASQTDKQSLTIPFHLQNVDILHFVKPAKINTSLLNRGLQEKSSFKIGTGIEASLMKLASGRPTAWKTKEICKTSDNSNGSQYSTCVRFTENTVKNFIGKGEVSELRLLQSMLPDVPEVKLAMIRLVTADGHQVALSVSRSGDVPDKTYDFQIQCPTVFLLCQLRFAVSTRVQKIASRNNVFCTSKEARSVLQQIKSVLREIQSLQDATIDRTISADQISAQTVQLWLRLRSIKYPT